MRNTILKLDVRDVPPGHSINDLGPSDSSDSGSDMSGLAEDGDLDSNTDAQGTGERDGVGRDHPKQAGADIGPDRVINADEAGLGGGLDQAEEAQLGMRDDDDTDLPEDDGGLPDDTSDLSDDDTALLDPDSDSVTTGQSRRSRSDAANEATVSTGRRSGGAKIRAR